MKGARVCRVALEVQDKQPWRNKPEALLHALSRGRVKRLLLPRMKAYPLKPNSRIAPDEGGLVIEYLPDEEADEGKGLWAYKAGDWELVRYEA